MLFHNKWSHVKVMDQCEAAIWYFILLQGSSQRGTTNQEQLGQINHLPAISDQKDTAELPRVKKISQNKDCQEFDSCWKSVSVVGRLSVQ